MSAQPLAASGTCPQDPPAKPRLRGWLHAGMFPASLAAGIVLIALGDSATARLSCAVYVLTACLLFGVSAVYHRGRWGERAAGVLRRFDHANIFLIIAGTYTPFTVLLLHGTSRVALLAVVWTGALLGIAFRTLWLNAPRWLYTPCYIALGWAAVFFLPQFARHGGTAVVTLIIVGGLLYSLGAVAYGLKRPNPSPAWFGFHEVFHACTLGAFTAQFVGVALIAM
jgi:hemolysin III